MKRNKKLTKKKIDKINPKNSSKKEMIEKNIYSIVDNALYLLLLMITSLFFSVLIQLNDVFKNTTFRRIIYNVLSLEDFKAAVNSLEGPVLNGCKSFLVIFIILVIPFIIYIFIKKKLEIKIFKKKILLYPISVKHWSVFFVSMASIMLVMKLEIPNFIINNLVSSNLYEEYYVEYNNDLVEFPEKKRNLITIYVESFENSVFTSRNGGVRSKSYMPLMEELTSEYINFSNNDKIGGFQQFEGVDYTASALIGQTAGIPIYMQTINKNNKFLEGAVSLGDILNEHGYKNYFIMGSDANFGNRKKYFTEHGNYYIMDYLKAKETELINQNYYTWWGFEDSKLYTFAQNMLLEIVNKEEPFNFSILTADTHFHDGYLDVSCPKTFDSNYANSFYCADIMLSNFINWIQAQDFYKNTTIIVVGDHITMRDNFFEGPKGYERTVYNLFINPLSKTDNTKNRNFSTLDMLPTTLGAIGVEIKNDRLALGTNLFSDKKTLMEEMGVKKFKHEIAKKSKYYKEEILKKYN